MVQISPSFFTLKKELPNLTRGLLIYCIPPLTLQAANNTYTNINLPLSFSKQQELIITLNHLHHHTKKNLLQNLPLLPPSHMFFFLNIFFISENVNHKASFITLSKHSHIHTFNLPFFTFYQHTKLLPYQPSNRDLCSTPSCEQTPTTSP